MVNLSNIWPPAYLLSSRCFGRQQPKGTGESPAKASLYELGIWLSNPPCNLHHNRMFKDEIRRIFVAAVDIELNVGESRDIATLRGTGHQWPDSYYSCWGHFCRSEPPINKDTGNPAKYDRHDHWGQQQQIRDIQQWPSGHGNTPKSLAGMKQQVMSGKKSLVIQNLPRHPHLRPNELTPALTPLS